MCSGGVGCDRIEDEKIFPEELTELRLSWTGSRREVREDAYVEILMFSCLPNGS